LGKTVQLAMAALLMALDDPDGGPILVLAPKPLLQQWQDELMELLLLPSARWNGRTWVDDRPSHCLAIAIGDAAVPTRDVRDGWQYVRDPRPSRFEDPAFDRIRRSLDASDTRWQFNPESLEKLSLAIRRVQLQNRLLPQYGANSTPCSDALCAEPVPTSKRRSIRPLVPISCPRSR
jgi:hypothetical protein